LFLFKFLQTLLLLVEAEISSEVYFGYEVNVRAKEAENLCK
jgi:hypothetical protein